MNSQSGRLIVHYFIRQISFCRFSKLPQQQVYPHKENTASNVIHAWHTHPTTFPSPTLVLNFKLQQLIQKQPNPLNGFLTRNEPNTLVYIQAMCSSRRETNA